MNAATPEANLDQRVDLPHLAGSPVGTLQVYDTTLRDGAQQEGIALSVADKLAIAALLDELGVGFIEIGRAHV